MRITRPHWVLSDGVCDIATERGDRMRLYVMACNVVTEDIKDIKVR